MSYAKDGSRLYRAPGVCQGCGGELPAQRKAGNPRKWCSDRCRLAALRAGPGGDHMRQVALASYEARRDARRAERPLAVAIKYGECRLCGKRFVQPVTGRRTYCTKKCKTRADNSVNGDLETRRSNKIMGAHRRAISLGLEAETFHRREIFDRDGWTCGICHEPVDKTIEYLSATIDHVVPTELGGPHTRANVQCSHLICNSLKANDLELRPDFDECKREAIAGYLEALEDQSTGG